MPEEETPFPTMPILHWWTLRKRFKERIADIVPGIVTDKYVAGVLNVREATVTTSVTPCLKAVGILAADNRTTDRMERWLADDKYAGVCREILADVYPAELLQAVPDPSANRIDAENWFASHTGTGPVAARKMTAFFSLLRDADLSKSHGARPPARRADSSEAAEGSGLEIFSQKLSGLIAKTGGKVRPVVQVTFQVVITPETTNDQIDYVFAQLARMSRQDD
ncbi:MAG: DUF5343 domain-containing protein [Deltaproteobacteria bacterium]|nr:DUF5343 domain-containing protein [Deltaproteobacteria bacterium]